MCPKKQGPHERGLVLRQNEELTMTLEDQMMNLSSMMSSRFVAPFLELTQKWEKLMSNISETIEVWMKVQAKWTYLEAIFIGSEDILPQDGLIAIGIELTDGKGKNIVGVHLGRTQHHINKLRHGVANDDGIRHRVTLIEAIKWCHRADHIVATGNPRRQDRSRPSIDPIDGPRNG